MATQAVFLKALTQIGSEWRKGSMHRVYFDDLARWQGLRCEYYNSGNIFHAWDNGEEISNTAARRWLARLADAKVWYDVEQAKFFGKNISETDLKAVVQAIKVAVEAQVAEMDEQEICK